MSLKENLLKKIQINGMARKVIASLAPREDMVKVDKETMRRLLEAAGCRRLRKRDLELYTLETSDREDTILVLDSELPVYRSSPDDVALRKSPLFKEMLSIRNIRKILNDADVIVSKREASVEAVMKKCIDRLDLSLSRADVETIENEGIGSLAAGDVDGVIESLSLFAELLGYREATGPFRIVNFHTLGAYSEAGDQENGQARFGPMILYDPKRNVIKFIDERIGSHDKEKLEQIHRIAEGKEKASLEGFSVFTRLKETVLEGIP